MIVNIKLNIDIAISITIAIDSSSTITTTISEPFGYLVLLRAECIPSLGEDLGERKAHRFRVWG